MFQVGDKVRMLRSSEEGVVIRIKKDIVEIETSDGFELPVLANELTKVSEKEKEYFRGAPVHQKEEALDRIIESKKPRLQNIGLAFEQVNDFLIRPYFINETPTDVVFVLSLRKKESYLNFTSGIASKDSETRIYEDLKKEDFSAWSKWKIDLIPFEKDQEASDALSHELKLKSGTLFKETEKFPFSEKVGYRHTVSLKEINRPDEVEQQRKQDQNAFFDTYAFDKTTVLDLHAEALSIETNNPNAIFTEQKMAFIKALDQAIAENVMEVTFIHGVGNGHLQRFIHKQLASNEHVEWFKEAQKEKFGYGATLAHFKA